MSLVLHYKFNEDTASLGTDSSGNSNDLTNGGGVVSISDPTYGNVAYFDGLFMSQMTLANAPATITGSVSRTFSYWVKRSNSVNLEIIHGQQAGTGGDEYRVQFHLPTTVRIYNKFPYQSISQSFTTGVWYHLGVTNDGTTQTFYVNGTPKGSVTTPSLLTATGAFMIGGSPQYSSWYFNGDMSDFRVYDDALSETQINTLYTEGPNADTGGGGGDTHELVQSGLVVNVNTEDPLSYDGTAIISNLVTGSTVDVQLTGQNYTLGGDFVDVVYTSSTSTSNRNPVKTTSAVQVQSIAFWMKKNSVNFDEYLVDLRDDVQSAWIILGTGSHTIGSYWSDNAYINGVKLGSTSDLGSMPVGEWISIVIIGTSVVSAQISFLSGKGLNMASSFGKLLVYDRELSEQEVVQIHGYLSEEIIPVVGTLTPVTVTPSVFFVDVEWEAVDGALFYKVEYTSEDSSETVSIVTSTTNLRISNLEANSAYTISLLSSSDDTDPTTYEQVGSSGSFSTLENVVANIDVETLRNSEGVFDISNFEGDDFDQHMNALFETGDQIVRSVNNEPVTTTFVKDGESYPLEQGVFSFAFSPSIGAGQTASLGDANSSYDEVNDVVVVDGVSHADGESFTLNGKIVTVYNI